MVTYMYTYYAILLDSWLYKMYNFIIFIINIIFLVNFHNDFQTVPIQQFKILLQV